MANPVSTVDRSRLHLAAWFLRWASLSAFVQSLCFGLAVATLAISWAARWQPSGLRTGNLEVWWEKPLLWAFMTCLYLSTVSMYMVLDLTSTADKCLRPGEGAARSWGVGQTAITLLIVLAIGAVSAPIAVPLWPAMIGAATAPCRQIATHFEAPPLLRSVESLVRECWIAFFCELALLAILVTLANVGGSSNPVSLVLAILTLAVWIRLAVQLAFLLRRGAKVAESYPS